jgi:hypothetical protein
LPSAPKLYNRTPEPAPPSRLHPPRPPPPALPNSGHSAIRNAQSWNADGRERENVNTPSEAPVGDGWDLDDEDVFSMDDDKSPAEPSAPTVERPVVDSGWVYDPETDIVPTRKRWVNPRPGPRTLNSLTAGH